LPASATGLSKDSVANVSHIATVDREFLTGAAGRIRGQLLKDVDNGVRLVLGL
jgi:mRNA interferase MazF